MVPQNPFGCFLLHVDQVASEQVVPTPKQPTRAPKKSLIRTGQVIKKESTLQIKMSSNSCHTTVAAKHINPLSHIIIFKCSRVRRDGVLDIQESGARSKDGLI